MYKKSYFPESYGHSKNKIKVELDLPSYAIKFDWKGAIGIDTSKFAKETGLANLKSDFNELDISKTGFNLTFQKWFVNFPNQNNRKIEVTCRQPIGWWRNFLTLACPNQPYCCILFFLTICPAEKHKICILYLEDLSKKNCIKELSQKSFENISN